MAAARFPPRPLGGAVGRKSIERPELSSLAHEQTCSWQEQEQRHPPQGPAEPESRTGAEGRRARVVGITVLIPEGPIRHLLPAVEDALHALVATRHLASFDVVRAGARARPEILAFDDAVATWEVCPARHPPNLLDAVVVIPRLSEPPEVPAQACDVRDVGPQRPSVLLSENGLLGPVQINVLWHRKVVTSNHSVAELCRVRGGPLDGATPSPVAVLSEDVVAKLVHGRENWIDTIALHAQGVPGVGGSFHCASRPEGQRGGLHPSSQQQHNQRSCRQNRHPAKYACPRPLARLLSLHSVMDQK
mmetsp:Transcript_69186/g.224412  ORF Transcript_69186/g.224412 Transcript_69186/m.224412 type:complete len:304 (-) Transcript_69186:79-990(-)